MTDTEARYIREYLDQNPRHLHAAFAVARAWPTVKHDVCRRFLEHLRDRVEERVRREFPAVAGDLDIGCEYSGDKNWSNYLRVYRYGWVPYEGGSSPRSNGRTAVMLECGTGGPTSWHWGVRSGRSKDSMTELEKERRERVEGALKRHGLSNSDAWWWPHIEQPRYQDWTAIVPELVQELTDGGGKITDHYVDGLLGTARKAIPAIDEVELENQSPSAPENRPLDRQLLDLIETQEGLTERELAKAIFGPEGYQQQVNVTCRTLLSKGLVQRCGDGGTPDPYRYYLKKHLRVRP